MSSKIDFPKWQNQIEELASHFELDVISNAHIFERYKAMVQANSDIDSPIGAPFHQWVERNHYYGLLTALRKIFLLKDKNEVSLLKIINELINSGTVVTTQNYPGLIGITGTDLASVAMATSASSGFFDSSGKLAIKKLKGDKNFLENTMRSQFKFTDEKVLHIQKNPKALILSDVDLEQFINKLQGMLEEYRLFLTGSTVLWGEEDTTWGQIFLKPWKK